MGYTFSISNEFIDFLESICDAIREKGPTIQEWKFIRRAIEEIETAPNAFKDSFSIIHILQNNVDKKILIAPYERSVHKLTESRIIRQSIFWIVGSFPHEFKNFF